MEETGCHLTVRDVAGLLHTRYAIITGGRTPEGFPIITFPDTGTFYSLSDEDYRKLMLYLTNVPANFHASVCSVVEAFGPDQAERTSNNRLQDSDLGFVLIVDRRNDKWSAVKTVLLKISGYFPGLIQVVFVLRPLGFFQKAISEVSNKFFKEEFKFKLVICSTVEELHGHIDSRQLTEDLGGTISYSHDEWIEQRVAVEKFSSNLHEISAALREMTCRLQETEFPNDVASTLHLLQDQEGEYKELKDDIRSAAKHGESLLSCIRRPSVDTLIVDKCPDRLINVSAVERLLLQLDETEKGFDSFWSEHEKCLSQCLELRKFEQEFKELQVMLAASIGELSEMPETGDSVTEVDNIILELERFHQQAEEDLEKAEQLKEDGEKLIGANHYAVDSIAPKCVELDRMVADIRQQISSRMEVLRKNRDLQERIEKANRWCTRGVSLLASQQIEKYSSPTFAETALKELEDFLQSSSEFRLNDPREFHNIFKGAITPESRALVQQVLKRIEDVQMMCEKRRNSLKRLVSRPPWPVQAVVPEPAVPLGGISGGVHSTFTRASSSPEGRRKSIRKAKTVPKVE